MNAKEKMRYPLAPTHFLNSRFNHSFIDNDYFYCADGDGNYPNHHCKETFLISKPFLKLGGVAIDIGCRDGEYSRYLSTLYDMTYCFDPRALQRFADNLDLNKVIHFACALGESQKKIVMSGGQHNISRGYLAEYPCYKLDDFEIQNVSYIKIDVEGYETLVLKGGIKTIEKFRPLIVIEQNDIILPGDSKYQAEKFLESLDYVTVATCERGWDKVMISK